MKQHIWKKHLHKLTKIDPVVKRVALIGFFLGIDLILGWHFYQQGNMQMPPKLTSYLENHGFSVPTKLRSYHILQPEYTLNTEAILAATNEKRRQEELEPLEHAPALQEAARLLATQFRLNDYALEDQDYSPLLTDALEEVGYEYQAVTNIAIAGPTQTQRVIELWLGDEPQDVLLDPDYTQTGLYAEPIESDSFRGGLVVQVLATPKFTATSAATTTTTRIEPREVPNIPDSEVVEALNAYRATHGVHQLIVDQNLCRYAEKRVQDLIAFGSLDGHAGFRADFSNPETMPESIKAYSGGRIGENLASQFCINGTTGDSFTASTGTALIEWCFDSSVKGHREAQLNPRYNAVCSRHGNHMYVVIFGE